MYANKSPRKQEGTQHRPTNKEVTHKAQRVPCNCCLATPRNHAAQPTLHCSCSCCCGSRQLLRLRWHNLQLTVQHHQKASTHPRSGSRNSANPHTAQLLAASGRAAFSSSTRSCRQCLQLLIYCCAAGCWGCCWSCGCCCICPTNRLSTAAAATLAVEALLTFTAPAPTVTPGT